MPIVKVQVSLVTSLSTRQMLINNKDKTLVYEGALTEEVAALMGDAPKKFFHATQGPDGALALGAPAPEQEW